MKSDREFIDGIYQKVREYEMKENSNKVTYHRGYRTLKPIFLTGMAIVIISTGVLLYQNVWHHTDGNNSINPQIVSEPGTPNMTRGIPFSVDGLSLSEDTIVEGKVVELSETENTAIIHVDEVYGGQAIQSDEIILDNTVSEDGKNLFKLDEKVLIYLQQDQEGRWILSDGTLSKYSFVNEKEGHTYYENSVGTVLDTSAFNSNP